MKPLKNLPILVFSVFLLILSACRYSVEQDEDNQADAQSPEITAVHQNVQVVTGKTETLFVIAVSKDGGTLSYQWFCAENASDDGTLIEGATFAVYTPPANESGIWYFYCEVTNHKENSQKTCQSGRILFEVLPAQNVTEPVISQKSAGVTVSSGGNPVILSCTAEVSDAGFASYEWFLGKEGNGTKIEGASGNVFVTSSFAEKGIYDYYCVVTAQIFDNGDGGSKSATATVPFRVIYTGLPTVYVTTPGSAEITSKTEWTKNATISVQGASNDEWNFSAKGTSIRGRGNSTWYQPKKPYALKLDKKQKIMDMPEHKRWVLIANYLDNSFLRNQTAFYLSSQMGLDWTVHGEFVDLVLNGEYKGLYWLGEAIKVDKNRVNINDGSKTMTDDEDKDYLIEMDVYYDEAVKFKSPIKNLPYMIKNDDYMIDDNDVLTSGGQARLARLQEKITALENLLYPDFSDGMSAADCSAPDESFANVLDIDSWAKFYLVNEAMDNGELGHPKSCYFTFDSANNVFKAGPVWDFDWATISQSQHNYLRLKNTIYFDALFKSAEFTERLKYIWAEHSDAISTGVKSQTEQMIAELAVAAEGDALLWGVNHNPTGLSFDDFKGHSEFLKNALLQKIAVMDAEFR